MKLLEYFKNTKNSVDNPYDMLPDGIFILEGDGKIVEVNYKILEMYNAMRYEFIGKYFSDFVEGGVGVLNQVLKTNQCVCTKAKLKDNSSLVLEINILRNPENNYVYVCARNATGKQLEQNSINERFTIAQKIIDEKNDFLLTSSGSILSSLVSIAGFSRALLDGIGGNLSNKQEKYLNIINTNSKDLCYDLEKLFALFREESKKNQYNCKNFDLIGLIKSIKRVYTKDLQDKKIIFDLDYSNLTKRDCCLDSEIVEYILRSVMEIFIRFGNLGRCSLNIGHPPEDFLQNREFKAKQSEDCLDYVLFEAKISDLIFSQEELENIFDAYWQGTVKRPIGLKASLNLIKMYVSDFGGDVWVYSKPNFGTMITFVLPIKQKCGEYGESHT